MEPSPSKSSIGGPLFALSTIGELYVRAIRRHGDQEALVDEHGSLTYRELGHRVAGIVECLRGHGLSRGDSIAQLSGNKIDAVCVIAAAFVAGLRYTPLHPLGAEDDHAFILRDAQIDCLVVDEHRFGDRGERLVPHLQGKRVVLSHGNSSFAAPLDSLAPAVARQLPRCEAAFEDIALIAYTGGTTGKPKGVVHRHRSLIANLFISMSEWDWGVPARFLAVTPISHASFLFILPVLLRGGTVALAGSFTPHGFGELVRRHAISTTFLVPTMIRALVEEYAAVGELPSLQTIIYGAAPIAPDRLHAALERYGNRFAQLYGQTEAPNAVCMLFKRHHDMTRPERLASCGVVLAGNEVRILREDGTEATTGEPGELCVRGPLVMDGYWNRPDETAQALRDDWLHTGDVARADEDGFLYLIDRRNDVIITGGFNVYPREVEDVLATHRDVAQSCVFGIPDDKWGEAVCAAVVLREGADTEPDELAAHVRAGKGPIQAPKRIDFVGRLPLTPLGKIDRRALRAPYWGSKARGVN